MGRFLCVVVVFIAVVAVAVSFFRNGAWADDISLYTDITVKSPGKARPHSNLSLYLYDAGRYKDAKSEALKSLRIYYYHPDAHFIVGLVAYAEGDYATSVKALEWARLLAEKYSSNPIYVLQITGALNKAKTSLDALEERRPEGRSS